jgi:Zn-dependent membrane protease YugP
MQISVTTPALLFPAISLFMLAYTNRFLSLGARIRTLHDHYRREQDDSIRKQIENLRIRVHMIRRMQGYGVLSMLTCIFAMVCLFQEWELVGAALFGLSLLFLVISLWISFLEIRISVRALDILLADIEKD